MEKLLKLHQVILLAKVESKVPNKPLEYKYYDQNI